MPSGYHGLPLLADGCWGCVQFCACCELLANAAGAFEVVRTPTPPPYREGREGSERRQASAEEECGCKRSAPAQDEARAGEVRNLAALLDPREPIACIDRRRQGHLIGGEHDANIMKAEAVSRVDGHR